MKRGGCKDEDVREEESDKGIHRKRYTHEEILSEEREEGKEMTTTVGLSSYQQQTCTTHHTSKDGWMDG